MTCAVKPITLLCLVKNFHYINMINYNTKIILRLVCPENGTPKPEFVMKF